MTSSKNNVIKFTGNKSFVISVSIAAGCYRHLKISSAATLEDLSEAITRSFLFYNENMRSHAFFMDNSVWSQKDCYYCAVFDKNGDYRHTCDYRLRQVMSVGSKFKYVFDFGEEWKFACRVLKQIDDVLTGDEDGDIYDVANGIWVEVVREKGEPPRQCREWDDDYTE